MIYKLSLDPDLDISAEEFAAAGTTPRSAARRPRPRPGRAPRPCSIRSRPTW